MKKRTSHFINHITKAWRAIVKLVILLVGDHRQEGRERTLQLGCLSVITGFMCIFMNSNRVIDGVNQVTSGIRGWVAVSGMIVTLLGGGTTVWWWAKRKSRWSPTVTTELHGLDGFMLLKEQMIDIIKSIDEHVFLWANKDRLYFKCTPQSEPFIRVFFNESNSVADIYCTIDLKDVPPNLAAQYPGVRLEPTSKFGTVLIPLNGSQELHIYKNLFQLAMLSGRRRS